MNNRELKIKSISSYLVSVEIQIRNLNSQNLCDLNIISETWICDLLNMVFDYKLKNTNADKSNFPSIDLVDNENRIAVQVTADKSKAKIQKTLTAFEGNCFVEKYDKLIIFILGEKQKRYSQLIIPQRLQFNTSDDIMDFKLLLKQIALLPLNRIEEIDKYLKAELLNSEKSKQNSISQSNFKKTLALKKRITRDLMRKMREEEWRRYMNYLYYNPSLKFVYDHLIIRFYKDKSFPEWTDQSPFSWMKGQIWDFYENGLEFVYMISENVVIEKDGTWCLTREEADNVFKGCCLFLRIPYENIISYDMEPDDYYGYPTLFVDCVNDGSPFEEKVYGLIGYYNNEDPKKSRKTFYLDRRKQKIAIEE